MDEAARHPCCVKIVSGEQVFDIIALIDNFRDWYARALALRTQQLTWQISSEIPRYFRGDLLLLRHLLYQTGKNSLLYLGKGKSHLEIEAEQLAGRRHTIFFTITLTETSMPCHRQRLLFQPARAQNNWQGLDERCSNLYYARTIARRFGGDIRILNDTGFGTRYRVEIHLTQRAG